MSDDVCAPDAVDLQAEFAARIEDLVDSASPVYYLWGGSESPDKGLDCSGLICWGCREISVPLPLGRPNTDALWDRCDHVDSGLELPGDLALYGTGNIRDPACHVMILIPGGRVAGMTGGGHLNTTVEYSKAHGALLRWRRNHLYRPDFIGWRRLPFHLAPGVGAGGT